MINDSNYRHHQLRIFFWFVAIALGFLHAWADRHYMNPDGMSYLDIGDAYLRGDLNMAINACWSPLYPWLLGLAMVVLKPSPYWEFTIVHIVNFIIYLCALVCFDFFLRQLLRYHREQTTSHSGDERVTLPEWVWLALGYTMFIWSSIYLITFRVVSPDMCVSAFVYLASGIILRIRMGHTSLLTFVLLGVVLGFGYLAKTPMLSLAFIFLGISMFSVGNLQRATPLMLIALAVFLLVASPFIGALSMAKGQLTFGDSAKLNYAYHVNDITMFAHWQGGPLHSGTPIHPTRKIFDTPAIYEFGTPIGGTYPPWYDPSYWYEGVEVHFEPMEQIKVLVSSATYYHSLATLQCSGLIVGFLTLLFFHKGRGRWFQCVKDIAEHWHLLIPAIAALAMYSLVHIEPRYIGAFVLLLWAGVFSGVRYHDSQESRRLTTCVTIAILAMMWITIGGITARSMIKGTASAPHAQWLVADGLKQMGIQPGDKVASIGYSFGAYWARLSRVRIVAEIPVSNVDSFWRADNSVKSQVLSTFSRTGAKVIVVEEIPSYVSTTGWQRIGNTDYYAYFLPP